MATLDAMPKRQNSGGAPRPSIPGGPPGAGSEPPRSPWRTWAIYALIAVFAIWAWQSFAPGKDVPEVSYSEFYGYLEKGDVEKVVIQGQNVQGTLKPKTDIKDDKKKLTNFKTLLPVQEDKTLFPLLHEKNVNVDVKGQPVFAQAFMTLILPILLLVVLWIWLSRRTQRMMGGGSGGPFGNMLKGRTRKFNAETDVTVGFEDVAGLASAKRDLGEVVEFLKDPAKFQRLGAKAPRGVLLVGPPGTGKTLLARAVAGESGVPYYSINGSEFIELFVGVGALRVRELFDEARKNEPSVIFIDEIDAVGRARGAGLGGGHDEREQTLNQLLSEMDGFSRTEQVVVIAATNRPDVLDPALLRPGRFDRQVVVDRPELAARVDILRVHVRGKPLAADVELHAIASMCPGFSGADLANLVNEGALLAIRRGAAEIGQQDFRGAFDKIVLGDPREVKLDPEEKKRVAIHEAGHAVVAHFNKHSQPLERVTIIPRGMALGVTMQRPLNDRYIKTKPELEAELRVLMGGYAAEQLLTGQTSSGAANDLKRAAETAFQMVAHYGMSEKLGPIYVEHQTDHPFLGRKFATDSGTSDGTLAEVEMEARKFIRAAEEHAKSCISARIDAHKRLTDALLEDETVEREQLVVLLGEPASEPRQVPGPAIPPMRSGSPPIDE